MSQVGILYNTFVCLVIAFAAFRTFYYLWKKRKEGKAEYHWGLDYFCLSVALIWFFIGLRAFLIWLGFLELNIFVYKWLVGPLTFIHLLPAFYYFSWSFFQEKKKRLLFEGFFILVTLAAVFTLYRYGFTEPEVTYWGNNMSPNKLANNIFTLGLFVPGFLCIITELVRRYKKWKQEKSFLNKQLLWFSIGFLAYAVAGILEVMILTEGWYILLARIGVMIPPLIFYFSATLEEE